MSEYVIVNGELYHYGVKGMKWGVRRATKRLAKATTADQRKSAITSLQKHRSKGAAELDKLKKKEPKLQEKVNRAVVKYDTKSAELKLKANKLRARAARPQPDGFRANKLNKATALEAKSDLVAAKSQKAKAALAANRQMQELFQNEIDNVDRILVERGKKYLKSA